MAQTTRSAASTFVLALIFVLLAACSGPANIAEVREALTQTTGTVRLPPGVHELSHPLVISETTHHRELLGDPAGTTLRAASDFNGRALIICQQASNIRLHSFTIDGNRAQLAEPMELPPSDVPFVDFYPNNGILADEVDSLEVSDVGFHNIPNFAVLIARSRNVTIERITVRDSGSRNSIGRNNTSGGVLLEEGTANFEIRDSRFINVLGNGVWTHSMYESPRNKDGLITGNNFDTIARDAIQIGHATNVRVENNEGKRIGYPLEAIDLEGHGTPVAIDTAGNVDNSAYVGNRFEEINGKCIDLDGFHHGRVERNTCINRGSAADYAFGHYAIVMNNTNPDMQSEEIVIAENVIDGTKFGGIFIIGSDHRVVNNQLRNLNTAGCNEAAATYGCMHFPGEPDLLQSGIYLGRGAERPADTRSNSVEGNLISGHKMKTRCLGFAPSVSRAANKIGDNTCEDLVNE